VPPKKRLHLSFPSPVCETADCVVFRAESIAWKRGRGSVSGLGQSQKEASVVLGGSKQRASNRESPVRLWSRSVHLNLVTEDESLKENEQDRWRPSERKEFANQLNAEPVQSQRTSSSAAITQPMDPTCLSAPPSEHKHNGVP
jgi:hypothetical protein